MDRGRWVRNWIPVAVGVLLAVPLGLAQTSGGSENPLSPCLEQLASSHADADAPAADPDQASGPCALRSSPETFADLADASNAVAQRVAADSTADYAAAARERARLAESGSARVSGANGTWQPVGRGPLHADDPNYPSTYGDGFAELAGRVSDYAYDSKHGRLFAAVASGGVWVSRNMGESWHSIGDSLPTQTVGSIAYSPAQGGTLIAVTGDNAF